MGVIVSSIFRDSASYIDRYVRQVSDLRDQLGGEPFQLVLAEGDSVDGTYELLVRALADAKLAATVLRVDHGGPKYGSVDREDRWRQIALVCNAVMERASMMATLKTRFMYVESDLVWPVDVPLGLFADLERGYPAVSPMSFHSSGLFYDTWGYRKDGVRFTPRTPIHPGLIANLQMTEIDSSGSCFVLRGDLVKTTRFSPVDCILEVGRTIRAAGGSLWLDQRLEVIHP